MSLTETWGKLELEPKAVNYVGDVGFSFGNARVGFAENGCDAWFKGAQVYYLHTARTAIQKLCSLLNLRGGDEVLVPAYNCGSEVDALLEGGVTVRLFRVNRSGEMDLEDLNRRLTNATKAIYVIHYFGFAQPMDFIAELCRNKGLYLVEDCALSTLTQVEGRRIGGTGDVAVYNFPKVLPVPDGGALVINNPKLQQEAWTLGLPELGGILKSTARLLRQGFLRALPNATAGLVDRLIRSTTPEDTESGPGRREMPSDYYCNPSLRDRGISRVSAFLIRRMDFAQVRERRRQNFSHLRGLLSKEPRVTALYQQLPEGVCPLCFPILVEHARKVAFRLAAASIPALPWWSGYNRKCREWDAFPDACHLKDHVVALPVHHQLTELAIERIAKGVADFLR